MVENTYIFFRNDQHKVQYSFDPRDPECLDQAGYKYFGRVLNYLSPLIEGRGLTFYVTAWTVHELPTYGENIISCILQDEWGREPKYRDKVGMVFKTCGRHPIVPEAFGYGGVLDSFVNVLAQGKALLQDGTGRIGTACSMILGNQIAPIYEIPLGYYAKENVTYIPINSRRNDLYFAGSMQHITGKGQKLKRPKELARRRMENALKALAQNEPKLYINSCVTSSFGESILTDNSSYLNNMMNTKICPIPRGANLETFRFYEAIRYGCIPVSEALPKAWYYDGAPIIRLKDWSELGGIVTTLLADTQLLQEKHEQVLKWWKEVCSETALAHYMAERIYAKYVYKKAS